MNLFFPGTCFIQIIKTWQVQQVDVCKSEVFLQFYWQGGYLWQIQATLEFLHLILYFSSNLRIIQG